jgi:predicted RNA binding protein YcfA (HicA-like mRNA interferase family)
VLPKLPRLTPQEVEDLLVNAGFKLSRSKGSHCIYLKENRRQIIPFHASTILHPKIVKQIYKIIAE